MKTLLLILLLLNINLFTDAQMITNRDSLKQVIATTIEDTSKINALWNLGFSYTFVHQDSAILFSNEGLELSKKTGNTSGEANNNMVLAMALTLQGNYPGALQYGFNYLANAEMLNDTVMIMQANDQLAICYREQEDYSEALKYAFRAEELCRKLGPKTVHWPFVLGNLSAIYDKLNNLDSALYYGLKSYSLIKYWSGIYLRLGTIYTKLGKPDSAFFYYRAGIPYAKEYFI